MLIISLLAACSILTNRGRPGRYDRDISTVRRSFVDLSCDQTENYCNYNHILSHTTKSKRSAG